MNVRYNDNVMEANEVIISSLDEFVAQLRDLKGRKIIYRGQSDAAWKVTSTSYRELKERNNNKEPIGEDLVIYNEELIEKAYHHAVQELGEPIYDLRILAHLRLTEATNLLIDFTESPAVALWYACKKDEGEDRVGKSGSKVFCLDIGSDGRFHKISRKNQKEYLLEIIELLGGKTAKWQPPLDPRVAKQDSHFIFNDEGKLDDDIFAKIIIIDEKSRDGIFEPISILCNFSGGGLSPDLRGIEKSHKFVTQYKPTFEFRKLDKSQAVNRAFEIALELQLQGNHTKAIVNYDEVLKHDSDFTVAYLNRGSAKAILGRYEEAIADFDEALKRDSELAYAYLNRGNAQANLRLYEAAIADFDKALKIHSKWAYAYHSRGAAKFDLGLYEEAIIDLDKSVSLDSGNVNAYYRRGMAKANLGRYEQAFADFDRAISLDSGYAEAYYGRGLAQSNSGRLDGALADFDKALSLNLNHAGVYHERGFAKTRAERYEEAIADFDKALDLNPEYAEAYYGRGLARAKSGHSDKVLVDFDKALSLNFEHAEVYYERGFAKLGLKRFEDALVDFDKSVSLNPEIADAYLGSGTAKANLGRYEEALGDFNKAMSLNPNDVAGLYFTRGVVKQKLGLGDEASKDFKKARKLEPGRFENVDDEGNPV